jgi:uncharacterized 2Fe-2S/4Fe-4S cluster protein (DUF4445 family)
MTSVTIAFDPTKRKAKVRQGINILNAAIDANLAIRAECGGNGICGKCRIIARDKNATNEITDAEKKHLSACELRSGYRLACQTIPKHDVRVMIPKESRIGERRILVHGMEKRTTLNPLVKKFHVKMRKPTLSDSIPDFDRLLSALLSACKTEGLTIEYAILRELPDILRDSDWNVTITVWDDKRIISVEPGDTTRMLYGYAVDVGTSKVVGHLVNLTTGKTVSTGYIENPQLAYGADIITRIAFAMEGETNRQTLQKIVLDGINKILVQMCVKTKVDPNQVYETVLVGNTAMHHLCLGIQSKYTALSPYTAAVKSPLNLLAKELEIKINPNGVASFLPNIAAFVGADAIADIVATAFYRSRKMSMLIDIGTNTEVFVGNFRDIVSCSCASGPAFEGARIKHGMKAEVGAIERIRLKPDFEVEFETIGNVKPKGLCGSAMIDVVAEMFKHGIIDTRGRFDPLMNTRRLKRDHPTEFVVAWADETATKNEIVITQRDIGEIQLAKAAIFAGCSLLMKTKNVVTQDLARVLVAGTFGNYVNPENAKFLGLVPDVATEKIEFVGNTAVEGAKMALVSKEARKTTETLSKQIRYFELATAPEFGRELAEALFIPHRDLKRFPSVKKSAH